MTFSAFMKRYWRVMVVAALGGLIAFAGSFITEPTYASSTRLLIHGRDATFLTSDGRDLSDQPGVVDASMAKALAETQAGVATSRDVATIVVNKLDLDAPAAADTGVVSSLTHGLATAYRCTKALITYGFCDEPSPREAAIQGVQTGLTAGQLGATSGQEAGQPGSYVMELVGTGNTPEQARAITNTAANALVQVSNDRFHTDSQGLVRRLSKQLDEANSAAEDASAALARYRENHDLNDADAEPSAKEQTQVATLERTLRGAESTQTTLNEQHQTAVENAARASVDVTRIDTASTPTYPVSPKRYLYLALGLLLGGLAGGALTWLARRRELVGGQGADAPESSPAPADGQSGIVDLREETTAPAPESASRRRSGPQGSPP